MLCVASSVDGLTAYNLTFVARWTIVRLSKGDSLDSWLDHGADWIDRSDKDMHDACDVKFGYKTQLELINGQTSMMYTTTALDFLERFMRPFLGYKAKDHVDVVGMLDYWQPKSIFENVWLYKIRFLQRKSFLAQLLTRSKLHMHHSWLYPIGQATQHQCTML